MMEKVEEPLPVRTKMRERNEEEGSSEEEVLWFHLKPPRLKGALTASVAVRLIIIL